jgi:hypothetical protein
MYMVIRQGDVFAEITQDCDLATGVRGVFRYRIMRAEHDGELAHGHGKNFADVRRRAEEKVSEICCANGKAKSA